MDTLDENPYRSPVTPVEEIPSAVAPELASRLTRLAAAIRDSIIGL